MPEPTVTSERRVQRKSPYSAGYFLRVTCGDLPLTCIFKHRWRHAADKCDTFFCFQKCDRCHGRQIRCVRFVVGDGYPAPPDPSWAFES